MHQISALHTQLHPCVCTFYQLAFSRSFLRVLQNDGGNTHFLRADKMLIKEHLFFADHSTETLLAAYCSKSTFLEQQFFFSTLNQQILYRMNTFSIVQFCPNEQNTFTDLDRHINTKLEDVLLLPFYLNIFSSCRYNLLRLIYTVVAFDLKRFKSQVKSTDSSMMLCLLVGLPVDASNWRLYPV